MNKADIAVFVGLTLISFYIIWNKKKKKKVSFDKEIIELENAVKFAISRP